MQWLLEVRLFERVLSAIDVRENEWVHANAAQVACEAIRIVRENAALMLSDRANANASGGFGMGLGMGGMGGMGMTSTPPSALAGANSVSNFAKLEQLLDHVHSYAQTSRVLHSYSAPLLILL